LDTGELPKDWRDSNISSIFRKGDKHLPENYRPVSLASVTCKILEHMICRHLLKHLVKNKILTNVNHGFRSGYSCESQLITTINNFLQKHDKGQQVDIAILDFSKAFDTLPLGPIMFLCHINDLPDCVNSSVRLFADDCLLYRTIKKEEDHLTLQADLKHLEEWANKWGMRFNTKECYVLSINNKSSRYYQIEKQTLQEVQDNPYLGLQISNDLKWSIHISNVC
jgi:hypothetical protein